MIYDTELERTVLATMEHDLQSREIYLSMLQAHHFYSPDSQKIFNNISQGIPAECDMRDMMTANHEYYATILKELHLKRVIMQGCADISREINESGSLDDIVPKVERLQKDVVMDIIQKGMTITEIEELQKEHQSFQKIESAYDYDGFYDEAGSHKGQTEVIFGHPKHGKTVYAINRVCGYLEKGYKGLFITMEDTHLKIMHRIGQQLGHDHGYKDNIILADRSLGAKNLDDIVTFLRYHKIADDIDFACVDYIQRIPVKGLSARDEVQKVIEVSNRMTDLANELDLFMILLAQPHRIEKHRQGWSAFPQVEDLYGSGAIEKDAFVATAVFRPNQVEKLCNYDHMGQVMTVNDWNNDSQDKNSVYIKQRLNREAERSSRILHMVHTDNGLNRITQNSRSEISGAPF